MDSDEVSVTCRVKVKLMLCNKNIFYKIVLKFKYCACANIASKTNDNMDAIEINVCKGLTLFL